MTLTETCLASFVLCVLVVWTQGLEFTINRTLGSPVCGHLHCFVNTDQNDQSIFSIVGLTIYDVTQAANKEKIASVTVSISAPELQVEPSKSDAVSASGTVSRYHADLSLDLKKATDCQNVTFQCELDFMSLSGQLASQQKTLAPPKSDCTDDLAQTAADLRSRTQQLEDELNRLNQKYNDLETKVNNILGQDGTFPTGSPATQSTHGPVVQSTHGPVVQSTHGPVVESTHGPVVQSTHGGDIVTHGPATTQSNNNPSTRSGCAPGMSLNNAREKFTLPGNIQALCDTETDGGRWVIIQRRTKGDVDFYKNWADYKKGFGTPDTDFWLGNDVIHNLVSQGYTELRIDMTYHENSAYAHYSTFNLGDENSKYKLTVGGYSGTAGDNLDYHNGMGFTTFDQDNDKYDNLNCAEDYHGAWWYKDCYESNLNGEWGTDTGNAMIWNKFVIGKPLSSSEMKIRHV